MGYKLVNGRFVWEDDNKHENKSEGFFHVLGKILLKFIGFAGLCLGGILLLSIIGIESQLVNAIWGIGCFIWFIIQTKKI